MNSTLSIVIVNYRSEKVILSLIDSIKKFPPSVSYECIVIDNQQDSTLGELISEKHVTYQKNESNVGYGAGCNQGVNLAKGELIFVINPDTRVTKDSIDELINALKDPDTIMVAPHLFSFENNLYPLQGTKELTPLRAVFSLSLLHRIWPLNPIARSYWLKDIQRNKPYRVSVVPGTAFMISKSDYLKVGGFDERFFLYFEEFDLCKRLDNLGTIKMIPDSKILHRWEHSTSQLGAGEIVKHFRESRYYYFRKHYGIPTAIVVEILLRIGTKELIALFLLLIMLIRSFMHLLNP